MIRFTALIRCPYRGRSSFMKNHANGLEMMQAFLMTCEAIG